MSLSGIKWADIDALQKRLKKLSIPAFWNEPYLEWNDDDFVKRLEKNLQPK